MIANGGPRHKFPLRRRWFKRACEDADTKAGANRGCAVCRDFSPDRRRKTVSQEVLKASAPATLDLTDRSPPIHVESCSEPSRILVFSPLSVFVCRPCALGCSYPTSQDKSHPCLRRPVDIRDAAARRTVSHTHASATAVVGQRAQGAQRLKIAGPRWRDSQRHVLDAPIWQDISGRSWSDARWEQCRGCASAMRGRQVRGENEVLERRQRGGGQRRVGRPFVAVQDESVRRQVLDHRQ